MSIQDVTGAIVFNHSYLKRATATFGFNNTPTSLDLELVDGSQINAEDVALSATGYNPALLPIGSVTGLAFGNFNFVGTLKSYTFNFGPGGRTWSLRMEDPRWVFPNIYVNIGISNANVDFPNFLNAFDYYGDPYTAEHDDNGMGFRKIREFLEDANTKIQLFDRTFNLSFTSGFYPISSGNQYGIPDWYRVPGDVISLEQLIQTVAENFNMDYYAHIEYDAFNPAATNNTITIQHIFREATGTTTQLLDVINGYQASGILQSYKYGEELRPEPLSSIIVGENETYWKGFNASSDIWPYWGRSDDGSPLVFTNMTSPATTTNINNPSGIVLLDHIRGALSANINRTVGYWKIDYQRTATSGYPPELAKTLTFVNQTGYYASQTLLRAALYNQESWEAVLSVEQPSFANAIGVGEDVFMPESDFISKPDDIKLLADLSRYGADIIDRTDQEEALISAIYQATKNAADNHYGRTWFVYAGDSDWADPGTTFNHTQYKPLVEFAPAESAWAENLSTPSGFNNHILLLQSNDPTFRDDLGRFRAFLSITNYNTFHDATYFPYRVDTGLVSRQNIFIEQGPKLVLPVTVEQYDLDPRFFIVTLGDTVQAAINVTGYQDQQAYYDFLVTGMGYSDEEIKTYNLMENGGENNQFGLAPARPYKFLSTPDNFGLHIPITRLREPFGPFYASGTNVAGINFIADGSLTPNTYGTYQEFYKAGNQLASRSVGTKKSIDLGELQLAGYPLFNIGESFGNNNNITALSLQYGPDGLTTNYSIRTFAYPNIRITKLLTDKIVGVQNRNEQGLRDIVDIDKVQNQKKDGDFLFSPSQISDIDGRNKGNKRNQNTGATEDAGYISTVNIPTIDGVYNPSGNKTREIYYS